jgi:hypothetical protein
MRGLTAALAEMREGDVEDGCSHIARRNNTQLRRSP